MNKNIKGILEKFIENDFIWKLIRPFVLVGIKLNKLRNTITAPPKIQTEIDIPIYFKSLQVLNGPFRGMKYPKIESVGSVIYPKLIGSYEREIQPIIESFSLNNYYSEIIDVGCAEGYYAVGMALRCENSKIYAFDTNNTAQKLCSEMADLNEVTNKVFIGSTLTPEMLKTFNFTKRGLIICDCEGYEKDLFNKSNISNLKTCDLIIETHDFKDIEISTYLKGLFEPTHNIESIYSIDDIQKALNYNYPQIENINLNEKKRLFREWRPSVMEWLICTPRSYNNI